MFPHSSGKLFCYNVLRSKDFCENMFFSAKNMFFCEKVIWGKISFVENGVVRKTRIPRIPRNPRNPKNPRNPRTPMNPRNPRGKLQFQD